MKTLTSVSAASLLAVSAAALLYTSTAAACANCNVAIEARVGADIGQTCEYSVASTDGIYTLSKDTVVVGGVKTNNFKSVGTNGDRGSLQLLVRGQSTVSMTVDSQLYTANGQTPIAGIAVTGLYEDRNDSALQSQIRNYFGGATVFSDGGATMSIDVSGQPGTQRLNFQVGGKTQIKVAEGATKGNDPLNYLIQSTNYTIKHVATCTQ